MLEPFLWLKVATIYKHLRTIKNVLLEKSYSGLRVDYDDHGIVLLQKHRNPGSVRVVSRSPDRVGTSNQVHRNSRNHAHPVNYVRKFDGFSRKRENPAPSFFANYLATYSTFVVLQLSYNYNPSTRR